MAIRQSSEHIFKTFDGTELFYRVWKPVESSNCEKQTKEKQAKALLLLHRGHEHSGRLQGLLSELDLDEYYAFAFDLRGHGYSPGPRGYAPDFSYHVADLDVFARLMSREYKIPLDQFAVVANSVGAVIASTWVHDYAPEIRCMALAAPAFDIKLYVPLALPGLTLLNAVKKPVFISSYVKAQFLTHDPEQVKLYEQDSLITRDISVNVLVGLYEASKRVIQDAKAIRTPTLVLSAGSDWVVKQEPQREFVDRLGAEEKEFVSYPGFYHGLLYEKQRHRPLTKIKKFIQSQFQKDYVPISYQDEHKQGFTFDEYQRLVTESPGVLKKTSYALQKMAISSLGRLSRGIRIGASTGFDSGLSLDHVYKNQAEGFSPLGKVIDYFYINQLGWKGIRQRKNHLQMTLEMCANRILDSGKSVRILDVAAGGGRYLLEYAKKYEHRDIQILLRDNDRQNISEAHKLAQSLGLKNIQTQIADAFDLTSYQDVQFSPNIVIVSGLYELFPNNEMILRSLKAIASILEEGGSIIYTGQPWHPQLEMIAHTLTNRDQKRWVMRRRTQGELDFLVNQSGFRKTEAKIDRWGIFTVSVATAS